MLERVHEHIVGELGQSARTDTIFVITAVVFNLVVLGINSAVAGEAADGGDVTSDTILGVLVVVSLIINTIAVAALYVGRATRSKLLEGLLAMYRDNEVAQYYDAADELWAAVLAVYGGDRLPGVDGDCGAADHSDVVSGWLGGQ